jgi:hypothetical protein
LQAVALLEPLVDQPAGHSWSAKTQNQLLTGLSDVLTTNTTEDVRNSMLDAMVRGTSELIREDLDHLEPALARQLRLDTQNRKEAAALAGFTAGAGVLTYITVKRTYIFKRRVLSVMLSAMLGGTIGFAYCAPRAAARLVRLQLVKSVLQQALAAFEQV